MTCQCGSYRLCSPEREQGPHFTAEGQATEERPDALSTPHRHFKINHQELNYKGLDKLLSFSFPFLILFLPLNLHETPVYSQYLTPQVTQNTSAHSDFSFLLPGL